MNNKERIKELLDKLKDQTPADSEAFEALDEIGVLVDELKGE